MTDILAQLSEFSWRGIEAPITMRDFGFQQAQASHRYIFRDEELIESLGRKNGTYRYTIPFREDLIQSPWKNLFTVVYPDFLNACIDRSADILGDPVHGAVRAKCVSLREILDVHKKDGIDVEAEFIRAPLLADITGGDAALTVVTTQSAQKQAGFFDAGYASISAADQKAIADLNAGAPPNLSNPLDAVSGIANQLEANGNKVTGAVNDTAFRAGKTADSIDRVKNPRLQPLRRAALRAQHSAQRLQTELDTPPRVVQTTKAAFDITTAALAGTYGMALDAFFKLNPALQGKLLVSQGTPVRHYKA